MYETINYAIIDLLLLHFFPEVKYISTQHVHSLDTHVPCLVVMNYEGTERDLQQDYDLRRFIFGYIYGYINGKVTGRLLAIVSSDYCQIFDQDGCWTHGNGVFQEAINESLFICYPQLMQMVNSFDVVCHSKHSDVFPSVLDLLGLLYSRRVSLRTTNRTDRCLLWNGKPSRTSCTYLKLIIDRYTNYERERTLSGNQRMYFEALLGTLSQNHGIMPYLNANQALLAPSVNRSKPSILVIFPGTWDQDMLTCSELTSKYDFIIVDDDDFRDFQNSERLSLFGNILHSLRNVIDKYRGRIDGVIGTGELPGCIFSSYIGTELGLCNPSLKEILRISHKYYSRQFQQTIVPDAVPAFALIPSSVKVKPVQLSYPFFVKPVKACTSMFARVVYNDIDLQEATTISDQNQIYNWIWYEALDQLIKNCFGSLAVSSFQFIGEGLLSGQLVTVDGFIQNGQVTIMGITDSIMYPNTMSFQRFEYPSLLPNSVQTRMAEITSRVIGVSNLNHTCFNVEFFYNNMNNSISIIEINSRMAYQFSDLFYWVDGQRLFEVQLHLAVGEKVQWIPRGGSYQVAASFVMRRFSDAYVVQTPTEEELVRVYHMFPMINIKILCKKGQRLSEIRQDVNSYRYATVNLATQTTDELHKAYASVKEILTFTFENIQ